MSSDTASTSASSSSSPSSSLSPLSPVTDDRIPSPARLAANLHTSNHIKLDSLTSSGMKLDATTGAAAASLSSPMHFPLLPSGSLFPSTFLTSSLLPGGFSSPLSPHYSTDSLQSLLLSLRATSSPVVPNGSIPMLPLQLLPAGPLLVLPSSLQSPRELHRNHSLPHPKLLTCSKSSVMHEDIPSSLPAPPSAIGGAVVVVGSSAMEVSPYTSPRSPLSPLSGSSTDSDDNGRDSSDDAAAKSKHAKRKSRKSLKRATPLSETDNDDTDSTHSASSSSSSSSGSDAPEGKKRRCVVSAQKLLTDSAAVDLSLSIVHFHQHSIRIIHTHSTDRRAACYVHGADVGGVIERKSNISRMFGQFESPREKVLMNVTGKHNHTVGQEANVLTVAGVERLMTLKKCAPNAEYCDWLRTQLLPRLREGNSDGSGGAGSDEEQLLSGGEEAAESAHEKHDEAEGEVVNVMATLCTATV